MFNKLNLLITLIFLISSQVHASKFKWDGDNDTVATALSIGTLTHLMISQYDEQEKVNLNLLDYQINSFDKSAIENWSPTASSISDILLITQLSTPLALMLDHSIENKKTLSLLYLQSFAVNNLITNTAKVVIKRKRPYVYNQALSDERRTDRESIYSFFSGHTSNAFMATAFIMKVMYEDKIYENYQPVFFPVLVLSAGTTAWLRYHAGKHFPTDIITGAIAGTACGLIIPELHQKENAQSNRKMLNFSIKF